MSVTFTVFFVGGRPVWHTKQRTAAHQGSTVRCWRGNETIRVGITTGLSRFNPFAEAYV